MTDVNSFLVDGAVFEIPWTGIAKATLALYEGCLKLNPKLQITVIHRRPLVCPLPPNLHSIRWGRSLPRRIWRQVAVPFYTAKHSLDVLHFPWNGGMPALVGRSKALKVMTLHDVLPFSIPDYFPDVQAEINYRTQLQHDLEQADLVITDSYFSQGNITSEFRVAQEPVVVYPTALLRQDSQEDVVNPLVQQPYFLYCGGYDRRKGIELLVETFLKLWRAGNLKVPLYLVGQAHPISPQFSQNLEEAIQLGGVQEIGYVSDAALTGFYRHALALVYPSRYEGFGLPPLEAMGLGCPVITYRLSSLPEVCGEAALYLDPDDEGSLSGAILKLASDELLRAELAAKGLKQAARFCARNSAETFLKALDQVVGHKANSKQL
ncbi:MAG: glycosyltransferase family 4 protein [Abitibacteriaceae bacterium]|nr:glycosyltransferase family 4 protein [Abditibacteriaceae bacterium]MBV9864098.1 glycosyltransferase family 4 protein [Abditibacteriaceae bacterium]